MGRTVAYGWALLVGYPRLLDRRAGEARSRKQELKLERRRSYITWSCALHHPQPAEQPGKDTENVGLESAVHGVLRRNLGADAQERKRAGAALAAQLAVQGTVRSLPKRRLHRNRSYDA